MSILCFVVFLFFFISDYYSSFMLFGLNAFSSVKLEPVEFSKIDSQIHYFFFAWRRLHYNDLYSASLNFKYLPLVSNLFHLTY